MRRTRRHNAKLATRNVRAAHKPEPFLLYLWRQILHLMSHLIAPSVLSADFANLGRDVEMINASAAD